MNTRKIFYLLLTIGGVLLFPNLGEARHRQTNHNECVILLHGLARTHHAMSKLESALIKHHYIVVNKSYPSTKRSVNTLAHEYISPMIEQCRKHQLKHIHFVTHSLGGIILQRYLQKNTIPELDRIVMLAPPNHGSPLADVLHQHWVFQQLLGPAINELTTTKKDISLKPGRYTIGVIAGNYSLNPFGYFIFDGPNDGKVSVSSTQIKQMKDFITLPATHTFMMQNALVEKQILSFLEHGRFIH